MRIALYPGSFDPVTFGHLDIIERSAKIFDRLFVGVLVNSVKTPLFSMEERVRMISVLIKGLKNVEVRSFSRSLGATVIVRGLRAVTDFEYELQLAQTNKVMAADIDTVFLTTNLKYSYLSSSTVKEIASYGGDIRPFVPENVIREIHRKLGTDFIAE